MKRYNKIFIKLIAGFILISLIPATGCKKLVEVSDPDNRLLKDMVYSTDQTAIAVMNGVLVKLNGIDMTANQLNCIPLMMGLSGDELELVDLNLSQELTNYYQNNLTPQAVSYNNNIWSNLYNQIFALNDLIEGVSNSSQLTAKVKTQLLGEARFVRALLYFYLTNLYGDIAYAASTDYKINSRLGRIAQEKIYEYIISDLLVAKDLLSETFLDGTLTNTSTERTRPTKWAASALLAKVYLYTENWELAKTEATKVLDNTSLFHLDSLDQVFLKNSNEAIWQTQPTGDIYNTLYALFFIIPDGWGPNYSQPTCISNRLLSSFETGDLRREKWLKSTTDINTGITYYYPYKYKSYLPIDLNTPLTEYNMMQRLADLYLIRSEAKAHLNDLNGSLNDLDVIRQRAGLPKSEAKIQSDILAAIQQERRTELFVEWGDRWFDLIRTGKIDGVMNIVTPEKGGTWSSFRKFLPISPDEIQYNSNLVQTPGYNPG